jgi:hypothetical protein
MSVDEEKYTPSVGILAALVTPELESFWAALDSQGWKKQQVIPKLRDASIDKWTKTTDGTLATIYTGVIGVKGQATAAVETIAFLDRCRPTNVILCGIAGSLNKEKYAKREVIVGSAVHWVFQDKIEDSDGQCDDGKPCFKYRPRDRPAPYLDDVDIAKRLQRRVTELFKPSAPQRGFTVHFEGIFSWDYVASGQHVTEKILELRNDVESLRKDQRKENCQGIYRPRNI